MASIRHGRQRTAQTEKAPWHFCQGFLVLDVQVLDAIPHLGALGVVEPVSRVPTRDPLIWRPLLKYVEHLDNRALDAEP